MSKSGYKKRQTPSNFWEYYTLAIKFNHNNMRFFEYLFFKYYKWSIKVGDGDMPPSSGGFAIRQHRISAFVMRTTCAVTNDSLSLPRKPACYGKA
jgi:hypothetical protein